METREFEQSGAIAGAWRAVDASANRAGEALRVVEDAVRFVLEDRHLTELVKQLRHDLAALLAENDLLPRVFLRDASGDVGATVEAAAALPRRTPKDLIAANAARGEQALRSLQESVLLLAPRFASRFEDLRYRLYAIERSAIGAARAADCLRGINLCVLVDGRSDPSAFARLVESLLETGVRMIQIRDKKLNAATLVARTRQALAIARRRDAEHASESSSTRGAIVLVNDRVDVAAALGADGAHTGSDDLSTVLVRRVIGPERLLGRTAHDVAEARAAVIDGADYLGVGPCFPSTTKSFDACALPEFLSTVAREISLPTFAIGGITLQRLDSLARIGLTRVAVASAVTGAADPAAAAEALLGSLAGLSGRSPNAVGGLE